MALFSSFERFDKRMKTRPFLIAVIFILLLSVSAQASAPASIDCSARVYQENNTAFIDATARDNPGLASLLIEFTWDQTAAEYDSIIQRNMFSDGTFLVNSATPGKLSVIWFSATNVTVDAPVFSVKLILKDINEDNDTFFITYSAEDTVNEKGETVDLNITSSIDLLSGTGSGKKTDSGIPSTGNAETGSGFDGRPSGGKEEPAPEITLAFTDVKESDYFYEAVNWAIEKKITSGVSETEFSPDGPCTRAQAVTFLWRTAGSPKPALLKNTFTDVSSDQYYYQAVLWAVENEITLGTSTTSFSPDETVTRGQLVTFLWRYAGKQSAEGGKSFNDVKESDYYAVPVQWAVQNGITLGTGEGLFSPNAICTRGQTVTFLYRAVNPQKTS